MAHSSGKRTCRLNNGRIALAVIALWEHGLIDEPTAQSWAQRRARRYRLTFITSGKAEKRLLDMVRAKELAEQKFSALSDLDDQA